LTVLAVGQLWPLWTWTSFLQRALYQAGKLRELEEANPGRIRIVRSSADLQAVLDARARGLETLGAVFGTEGAHALEGDLANLDLLYDAGLRVLGLNHFIDNDLSGSLHGVSGAGLTEFGAAVVRAANDRGIVIDVAHASPRSVRDVLSISERPVLLSHGGLKGICDSPRNLDDELMQEIASHGGLVGIGYWDAAVCDITPEGVVRSIRYAVDLLGVDHVALGSDYDGTVEVAFDASELAVLTQVMMDHGFSGGEIRKVMGENAVRFFLENLPG
jgi:microsomal dipeptidase-like Zn-dependent dipeptidase